ncbi:ESCRT-II complex subunit-domain-containing protein [Zopfochytrium polystomum]|nr:ESCRT-II complex subunit-domain-containing protein [Zopfochytrium polystomum]
MAQQKKWVAPPIHSFPPFFTRQPTSDTWERQKELWGEVILSYCQAHSGSLKLDVAVSLLDDLVARGGAEWLNAKSKQRCLVWWRKPEEWAALIHGWANVAGQSICTVFELIHGDTTESEAFHGMDDTALKKVLEVLVRQGKGQIFYGSSDSDMGFKFAL